MICKSWNRISKHFLASDKHLWWGSWTPHIRRAPQLSRIKITHYSRDEWHKWWIWRRVSNPKTVIIWYIISMRKRNRFLSKVNDAVRNDSPQKASLLNRKPPKTYQFWSMLLANLTYTKKRFNRNYKPTPMYTLKSTPSCCRFVAAKSFGRSNTQNFARLHNSSNPKRRAPPMGRSIQRIVVSMALNVENQSSSTHPDVPDCWHA